MLTQGDLRIQSAIPVIGIADFCMKIQKNSHSYFRPEGTVPEEEGEEQKIRKPVYQIEETEWEFLVRLALFVF